ncbi:MAG: glycoside hydrolase family 32 protein [Gemmatimonadota bacterium]|nr:glycoside hydrolase family 32 protein [Gemmatimonadota bacterium]
MGGGAGSGGADAAVREAAARAARDPRRPACHFRPAAGWMNDPNGTIFHGGRYHLFFQHHPYGDAWGSVHWGHAASPDLVRWECLPVALAPARELGEDHCFSGCAWRPPDGPPLLFYSSVRGDAVDFRAEQWVVRCDDALSRFARWEGNPVLPAGGGAAGPRLGEQARDPFVFEREGRLLLALAADLADEGGAPAVALFEAPGGDPFAWEYRGLLERGRPGDRYIECPNVLRLAGRDVLVTSPHGPVTWRSGRLDPDAGRFAEEARGLVDASPDFYATSVFAHAPGSDPVVVGWARGWKPGAGWNGALAFPRRLAAGPDGRPRQRPHEAVASLREGPGSGPEEIAPEPGGEARPLGPPARQLEVEARVEGDGEAGVRLRDGSGAPVAEVLLAPARREAIVRGPGTEPLRVALPGDAPREGSGLRLFWDRSLLEVFLEDGRAACTRVFDAASGGPVEPCGVAADRPARLAGVRTWPLRPVWPDAG